MKEKGLPPERSFLSPREQARGSLALARLGMTPQEAVPNEARRDAVPSEARDARLPLGRTGWGVTPNEAIYPLTPKC